MGGIVRIEGSAVIDDLQFISAKLFWELVGDDFVKSAVSFNAVLAETSV